MAGCFGEATGEGTLCFRRGAAPTALARPFAEVHLVSLGAVGEFHQGRAQ